MTCLEHLIENGLDCANKYNYNDFIKIMSKDINLSYTKLNVEDLWEICQYIIYDYCIYCERIKNE